LEKGTPESLFTLPSTVESFVMDTESDALLVLLLYTLEDWDMDGSLALLPMLDTSALEAAPSNEEACLFVTEKEKEEEEETNQLINKID
jgi:hypothetical protein